MASASLNCAIIFDTASRELSIDRWSETDSGRSPDNDDDENLLERAAASVGRNASSHAEREGCANGAFASGKGPWHLRPADDELAFGLGLQDETRATRSDC